MDVVCEMNIYSHMVDSKRRNKQQEEQHELELLNSKYLTRNS